MILFFSLLHSILNNLMIPHLLCFTEMVAASVARAISDNSKFKSEQDLSSDIAGRDLNLSAAEHAACILNMREVSESRSSVNFVISDDMLTSPSSQHSNNENNDLDDYNNGSSAKAFHPDDFRRRLVPFADIFNRPLPTFPHRPVTHDKMSKNEEGYCCVSKGEGGVKSIEGEVEGDFIDRKLADRNVDSSNESSQKLYPVLQWKLKAGVMHVYNANNDNGVSGSSSILQPNDVHHHDNNDSKNNGNSSREKSDKLKTIDGDSQSVNLFPVLSFEEFVRDFNQVCTGSHLFLLDNVYVEINAHCFASVTYSFQYLSALLITYCLHLHSNILINCIPMQHSLIECDYL